MSLPEGHDEEKQVRVFAAETKSRKFRWLRPLLILLVILIIIFNGLIRRNPKNASEGMPQPPEQENAERSRSLQSGIARLRGWEFETGSIGETLYKFLESGAPDYARTVLVFKNIDFSADTDRGLNASQQRELDDLAKVLNSFPDLRVEIGTHSDQSKDVLLSYSLSRREAETIKRHLQDRGIISQRLETRAFGFESPLTDNLSSEAKAQNRRVELLILQMAGDSSAPNSSPDTYSN